MIIELFLSNNLLLIFNFQAIRLIRPAPYILKKELGGVFHCLKRTHINTAWLVSKIIKKPFTTYYISLCWNTTGNRFAYVHKYVSCKDVFGHPMASKPTSRNCIDQNRLLCKWQDCFAHAVIESLFNNFSWNRDKTKSMIKYIET